MKPLAALLALLLLAACSRSEGVRFHETEDPADLADWGIVSVEGGQLRLAEGSLPYELATPLFTDHASKLRTLWIPAGKQAAYNPTGALEFPVGTIISKTFYLRWRHPFWSASSAMWSISMARPSWPATGRPVSVTQLGISTARPTSGADRWSRSG